MSGAQGESKVREGSPKKIMLDPSAEEWVTFSHTDSEKGTPFAESWRYSRGVCVFAHVRACIHTCAGTVREGVGSVVGGDTGKWKGIRKLSLRVHFVWIQGSKSFG